MQSVELNMQGKTGKPWRIKRGVTEGEQGVFRKSAGKFFLEIEKAEEIVVVSCFIRGQEAQAEIAQAAAPQEIRLGVLFRRRGRPGVFDGGGQGGEIRLLPGIVGHGFKNFFAAGAAVFQEIFFRQLGQGGQEIFFRGRGPDSVNGRGKQAGDQGGFPERLSGQGAGLQGEAGFRRQRLVDGPEVLAFL